MVRSFLCESCQTSKTWRKWCLATDTWRAKEKHQFSSCPLSMYSGEAFGLSFYADTEGETKMPEDNLLLLCSDYDGCKILPAGNVETEKITKRKEQRQ